VRLALYFERTAPELDSVYGILADTALYEVVRTALGIPAEIAASDIDKQADHAQVAPRHRGFQGSRETQHLHAAVHGSLGAGQPVLRVGRFKPAAEFVVTGFGITPELMLSINNLKLGGR
jgi:hypothetical protein